MRPYNDCITEDLFPNTRYLEVLKKYLLMNVKDEVFSRLCAVKYFGSSPLPMARHIDEVLGALQNLQYRYCDALVTLEYKEDELINYHEMLGDVTREDLSEEGWAKVRECIEKLIAEEHAEEDEE